MNLDNLQLMITAIPFLLQATLKTIYLSIGSMAGALIVGLIIAIFRITGIRLLAGFGRFYVSFFRGTPLLIQLYLWYYGLTHLGIVMNPWTAAFMGLSFHVGAYISESFRAAIQSIDKGQWEASLSLGMTNRQTFQRIILPQAWRRSIPPVFNSLVNAVKDTSLASILTIGELAYQSDILIASSGFVALPIILETLLIYWGLTTLLNIAQNTLEKRLQY
ncbi:MAG TPA: amino acid ABC transporter permease [Bacillales bacterium]|nr:amino acid ABC transporter permease [Bacillales bacterium]